VYGHRAVNRAELRTRIETTSVPRRAYSLDGRYRDEALVLEHRSPAGAWVVYYGERGEQSGLRTFATEDEACEHFWRVFARDVAPAYERWQARKAQEAGED
jgi:hypothetical protein